MVVYKSPSCGCCAKWVDHVKANGFAPTVKDTDNIDAIKDELGVPTPLRSCHVALVGGYLIERVVILSSGPELAVAPELLPRLAVAPTRAEHPVGDPVALHEVEREHIVTVLKQTGWRIDGPLGAASLLKMRPSTLRSRMQKLGIRRSAAQLT